MQLLLATFVGLLSVTGYSQDYIKTQRQTIEIPTNESLYKTEFEIKQYTFSNGDSTLLGAINFESLSPLRMQSVDVEVYDPTIDRIIILYSFDKIAQKYEEKFGKNQ